MTRFAKWWWPLAYGFGWAVVSTCVRCIGTGASWTPTQAFHVGSLLAIAWTVTVTIHALRTR